MIKFEMISSQEFVVKSNGNHHEVDEDLYDKLPEGVREIKFLIKYNDEENDEESTIGTVKSYIIESGVNFKKQTLAFDEVSYEMLEFCGTMIKTKTIPFIKKGTSISNFVFIDRIEIDELYRNKGIGTAFFDTLDSMLSSFNWSFCEGVVLKAHPIRVLKTDEGWQSACEKVDNFYMKNGFQKAKEEYFMFKHL